MKMGFAPIPGSPANRSSFIHVTDLCKAVVACVETDKAIGQTIELRDMHEGGYDWHAICAAASASLGHRVRQLIVPHAALWPVAAINEALARVTGRPFMLTLGKLRELFHNDWSVDDNRLSGLTDWRPEIGLQQGFDEAFAWYREAGWL